MRIITASAVALCLVLAAPGPAVAQPCSAGPDALGVARTVEIDTSAGPRFGAGYDEQSLLAEGEVVLTFDDGPLRAYARPVLEALAAQCTRATFFLVGTMALADTETVQDYARRGHTIGTHTWSHKNLSALSEPKALAEMELGVSAVRLAMGAEIAPFFRFPYLRETPAMLAHLRERHFAMFAIDIDSKDFRTRDPTTLHRRVMGELAHRRRGILLFHDIQPATARALPGLLADLKAKGFRVVHLIPKAQATTLPAFDALAERAFAKRHRTLVGQHADQRTLTLLTGSAEPQAAAATPAEPGEPAPKPAARPAPAATPGGNDWTARIWQ